MCRGGGPRAQELVRAGVVPTTPRSLERVRREMSRLSVVLCRPGNFLFVFSLKCVSGLNAREGGQEPLPPFDFCLSTSIPVLTTSTYVVAWPQGDQLL